MRNSHVQNNDKNFAVSEYHRVGRNAVPSWVCVFLVTAYLVLGAASFSIYSGWPFVDSLFFCFSGLATIGIFHKADGGKDVANDAEDAASTRDKRSAIDYDGNDNDSEAMGGLFVFMFAIYLLIGLALLAMCANLLTEGWWPDGGGGCALFSKASGTSEDGGLIQESPS